MDYEQVLDDMIGQRTFTFGDPWRFSEKSLAIVVPILHGKGGSRGYYVIEEVKEKVEFTDTGRIGGVTAKSKADKPVFIRSGSQFGVKRGGQATQERSVTVGTVVFPEQVEVLPTVCIHASQGISPGAFFGYSGVVPAVVLGAVASRHQGATWNAVSSYTQNAAKNLHRRAGGGTVFQDTVERSDDLVGFQERVEQVEEFKGQIEDYLSRIPADLKGQVGIAVLDLNGCVGLEVFDHEDSWKAFSKSVARSYSDVLMREEDMSDVFEVNRDRIVDHIIDFLASLKQATRQSVWQKENAATYTIVTDKAIGEYTTLEATAMIHLIVTRKTGESESVRRMERRVVRTSAPRETITPYTTTAAHPYATITTPSPTTMPIRLKMFLKRKGSEDFLNMLAKNPQTWSDLESRVNVSSRTLSELAKSARVLGLVEKDLRKNGRVVYRLAQKQVEEH